MTISSLIPSVSILTPSAAPGEGGGVCSYVMRPLLFGRSAKVTVLEDEEVVVDDLGRPTVAMGGGLDGCDRLTRFAGGCCDSVGTEGFESERR